MQKHNYSIDILRFFAALMVVLFHLNQAIEPVHNWYRNMVNYGALGVPVFFVISGYCIMISANSSVGFWDFLSRRFFRIYPAYWVSLIIVFIAACFQKTYIGFNAVHFLPRDPTAVLANITLATAPLNHIATINWVYWSLTCELFFYLTVGILLLANKQLLIYLLIAVSLCAALLPVQHTGILFFMNQWPAFGLGLSLYYYFNKTGAYPICCFAILLLVNLAALFQKPIFHIDYILFTLITCVLIFASNYVKMHENRLAKLGRYSYAVYLVHVPVGVFIFGLFEGNFIKQHPVLNLMYDLAVYAVVTIIAWQIFNHVEKPAIAYGRKATKHLSINLFQKTD